MLFQCFLHCLLLVFGCLSAFYFSSSAHFPIRFLHAHFPFWPKRFVLSFACCVYYSVSVSFLRHIRALFFRKSFRRRCLKWATPLEKSNKKKPNENVHRNDFSRSRFSFCSLLSLRMFASASYRAQSSFCFEASANILCVFNLCQILLHKLGNETFGNGKRQQQQRWHQRKRKRRRRSWKKENTREKKSELYI